VATAPHLRLRRARRAVEVARVARRSGLLRVLREIGVAGDRPATREGAEKFRLALEELGTTYIKLGQLLSSRPDLLPIRTSRSWASSSTRCRRVPSPCSSA
jgi:predicted unusual protein kinase regulating ubiquinone biosynthesis (AarF/ABC1/UbiB family)